MQRFTVLTKLLCCAAVGIALFVAVGAVKRQLEIRELSDHYCIAETEIALLLEKRMNLRYNPAVDMSEKQILLRMLADSTNMWYAQKREVHDRLVELEADRIPCE